GTRTVSRRALARHGIHLANTMRVGGTEAIKQAVAAGLGLAMVSRAAAADQLALGKLTILEVTGLEIRRTFTELRVRGRQPSPLSLELDRLLVDSGSEADEVRTASADASGVS